MSRAIKPLSIEEFSRLQIKNRRMMSEASRNIDTFRKQYGQRDKNLHPTKLIRKMRDTRR